MTLAGLNSLNVAVLHYWLVSYRGGERVLKQILKTFPGADIYTLFADPELCEKKFAGHNVYPSRFNLPILRKRHKTLFPLYPSAVKSIRLKKKYDLIVSSESGPIKGVRNTAKIPHICYIHSPMRYCWGYTDVYLNEIPRPFKPFARAVFKRLRKWDYGTKDLPDLYIANSGNVAKRVRTYYNRDAKIVYPPVEDYFLDAPLKAGGSEYYLYLGAVTPYKGVELITEAFETNKKPLIVASNSNKISALKSKAPDNITFVEEFDDSEKLDLYANAKALIFPAEEDFGIVPLEAMACGTPVIALGKGGVLETVIHNQEAVELSTGVFFFQKTAKSLNEAIDLFESQIDGYKPEFIRRRAERFRESVFGENFASAVTTFLSHRNHV